MMITWIELFILALASFRLTHLLVYDDIMDWLRKPFLSVTYVTDENGNVSRITEPRGKGLRNWLGSLISCHWCTGIWCATLLTALQFYAPVTYPFIVLLAVAGIAALIETYLLRKM